MKKKILKILLLIILIIVIVIGIPSIYKLKIINKSRRAYEDLENCDSYKYTYTHYSETKEGNNVDKFSDGLEIYYKNNVYKTVSTTENDEEPKTVYTAYEQHIENERIEIQENTKTFNISKLWPSDYKVSTPNLDRIYFGYSYDIEGFFKTIINCVRSHVLTICDFITCKVSTEILENRECYKFEVNRSNVYSADFSFKDTYYIDKETMLPIGVEHVSKLSGTSFYDKFIYTFEKNCVTDEDIKLPDLSDYTQEIY